MSTFEERLRARVENLIAETMDDCASEVRKAITPPAEPSFADRCECHGLTLTARLMTGIKCGPMTTAADQVMIKFESDPAFTKRLIQVIQNWIRMHGGLL